MGGNGRAVRPHLRARLMTVVTVDHPVVPIHHVVDETPR
jgi:hypothetical protein